MMNDEQRRELWRLFDDDENFRALAAYVDALLAAEQERSLTQRIGSTNAPPTSGKP